MIHGCFLSDGTWCTDDSKLREEAIKFYKNLFCPKVTITAHFIEFLLCNQNKLFKFKLKQTK
jgi:hypothetical protein